MDQVDKSEVLASLEKTPETFYKGFNDFVRDNPELVKKSEEELERVLLGASPEDMTRVMEARNLFSYGIYLARNLYPSVTSSIMPEVVVEQLPWQGGGYIESQVRDDNPNRIILGIDYLFEHSYNKESSSSPSPILNVEGIGAYVLTATEEYAHCVLRNLKSSEQQQKILKETETTSSKANAVAEELYHARDNNQPVDYFKTVNEQRRWYRSSRPEFSAVIWRQKMVRDYVPWMKDAESVRGNTREQVAPFRREIISKTNST